MAGSTNAKKCKIRPKSVMWVSLDPLLECWDPLISTLQMKLETSNMAQRWMAVSSNAKKCKITSTGSLEFSTPLVSKERLKLEFSNLEQRGMAVSNNKNMQH